MDLSSIFQAIPDLKRDNAVASVAALKIGDRLTGRVLRLEADGSALIDLGRFRARAQIGFPVRAGQALKLQVVQGGTPIHLQADVLAAPQSPRDIPRLDFTQVLSARDQQQLVHFLECTAKIPESRWATAPFSEGIRSALGKVQSLFDAIPIHRPIGQLANWLKGAMEERGVLFEKKMADVLASVQYSDEGIKGTQASQVNRVIAHDLKPQLMMLKSFLGSDRALEVWGGRLVEDDIEFVRQSVSRMLEHIAHQQDRVVRNAREGDLFQVFTHMLPSDDQKQPVQFKVFYPKKDGRAQSETHQHIALLLQMDRLGPVRVDLAMAARHLNVRIFVSNTTVNQRLERHLNGLDKVLKGLFDEVVLVTRVSEEKIKQFDQQRVDESPLGRIDIKV